MILIFSYGRNGADVYSAEDTFAAACKTARLASKKNSTREYCVELDPGSPKNPLYKEGKLIQGSEET